MYPRAANRRREQPQSWAHPTSNVKSSCCNPASITTYHSVFQEASSTGGTINLFSSTTQPAPNFGPPQQPFSVFYTKLHLALAIIRLLIILEARLASQGPGSIHITPAGPSVTGPRPISTFSTPRPARPLTYVVESRASRKAANLTNTQYQ